MVKRNYVVRFKKGNKKYESKPMTRIRAKKEARYMKSVNKIEGTRKTLGLKNIRVIKRKKK